MGEKVFLLGGPWMSVSTSPISRRKAPQRVVTGRGVRRMWDGVRVSPRDTWERRIVASVISH